MCSGLYELEVLPPKAREILLDGFIAHIDKNPPEDWDERRFLLETADFLASKKILSDLQAGIVLNTLCRVHDLSDYSLPSLIETYATRADQESRDRALAHFMDAGKLRLAFAFVRCAAVSEQSRKHVLRKLLADSELAVPAITRLKPPQRIVDGFVRTHLAEARESATKCAPGIREVVAQASEPVRQEYLNELIRIGDTAALSDAANLGTPLSTKKIQELFATLQTNGSLQREPRDYSWATFVTDKALRQEILVAYQHECALQGKRDDVLAIVGILEKPPGERVVELLIDASNDTPSGS